MLVLLKVELILQDRFRRLKISVFIVIAPPSLVLGTCLFSFTKLDFVAEYLMHLLLDLESFVCLLLVLHH